MTTLLTIDHDVFTLIIGKIDSPNKEPRSISTPEREPDTYCKRWTLFVCQAAWCGEVSTASLSAAGH